MFQEVIDRLLAILMMFGEWLLELPLQGLQVLLDQMWAALPASLQTDMSSMVAYFEAVNEWAPLGEALAVFGAVMTFKFVFVIVKLIVKLIPTVG